MQKHKRVDIYSESVTIYFIEVLKYGYLQKYISKSHFTISL